MGEVGREVAGPGVVDLGRGDELGVDVDPDDVVALLVQPAGQATGTAAGIEDARSPTDHGIDEPGLAHQVGALGRARAGQDYGTILRTYYRGTELVRLY